MQTREGKMFIPNVTQQDLDEWKERMSFVRIRVFKGKWPDGMETLRLMEEIYRGMRDEFATGEGIWVNS